MQKLTRSTLLFLVMLLAFESNVWAKKKVKKLPPAEENPNKTFLVVRIQAEARLLDASYFVDGNKAKVGETLKMVEALSQSEGYNPEAIYQVLEIRKPGDVFPVVTIKNDMGENIGLDGKWFLGGRDLKEGSRAELLEAGNLLTTSHLTAGKTYTIVTSEIPEKKPGK